MALSARMALAGALIWSVAGPALAQEGVRPMPRPDATLASATETAAPAAVAASAPAPAASAAPAPNLAAPAGPQPAVAAPQKPIRDPNRGSVTNLPLPRFVSLKGNEGNARRGPGLTHRIDWVFTRSGMPLKITAEFEHWRRVEDAEGVGGWVHYALLSGVRSVLVAEDMADFHARPQDGSEVLFRAERNVVGWVQECRGDWCRISVDGDRGWVQTSALWGVQPGEVIE